MTAEAPSAVSQSVVDGGADGENTPDAFVSVSNGNGHGNGFVPQGVIPVEDVPEPDHTAPADAIEAHVAEPDTGRPEPAESVIAESVIAESEIAEPEIADSVIAEPEVAEPEIAESVIAEPEVAEPEIAESVIAEPEVAEPEIADSVIAEPDTVEPDTTEPDTVSATTEDAVPDAVSTADQAYEVQAAEPTGPAEAVPMPVGLMSTEQVAAEVAEQLGTVVGEEVEADPAEFAAAAVLDVLRAAGWADAGEAADLKAEATRLRELLAEVIRDHRAREASAAGGQNQQLYWLVPLLRAAHGVAFGSLGAKVALRTAVQEVPPDVLALAGLRIDYGVEPAYEDQ